MESPKASPSWNTYADRFSTLEAANTTQPGHLSLEAAHRNADDTAEGKEVYEATASGASYGARRVCGMNIKIVLVAGFMLFLFVVGGVVGGVLGSQKKGSDKVNDSTKATEKSSPVPKATSSLSSASIGTSTKTKAPSAIATSDIASTNVSPVRTVTSSASNVDSQSPTTSSITQTTTLPSISTSTPVPVLIDFSSYNLYTFRSFGVPSSIATDPNIVYYMRAVLKPDSSNLTIATAINSSTLDTCWRIAAVPINSSLALFTPAGWSEAARTYWISNELFGSGFRLGLDKNDWDTRQTTQTPIIDFPPQLADEGDEGQYWFFAKVDGAGGVRYKMFNVEAERGGRGYRVVITVQGWLGVADEVMQSKQSAVDEWEVQEVG